MVSYYRTTGGAPSLDNVDYADLIRIEPDGHNHHKLYLGHSGFWLTSAEDWSLKIVKPYENEVFQTSIYVCMYVYT